MGRFFLAGVDAGGPRAHYGATLGPGRAPWRVLWAFKVARAGSFSRGLLSSGGWVKIKLKLPHFHVADTCRVSIQPDASVATAACPKATEHVSMSTRPDPEISGAVEIATRRRLRLRVVWDLRELGLLSATPSRTGPWKSHNFSDSLCCCCITPSLQLLSPLICRTHGTTAVANQDILFVKATDGASVFACVP